MKILILEYISGGGMRKETLPPSLAMEGARMLNALIDDLLALPGGQPAVELLVMADDRLPPPRSDARINPVMVGAGDSFGEIWRDWINRCDAVWPIAPETGGVLEQLCLDVETAGKILLASPAAAVRLGGSKWETAKRLTRFGLPIAHTMPLSQWKPREGRPFVVKPDDGAGCKGARIIRDPGRFEMPLGPGNWVAQDLLEGDSISLSVLFGNGEARLLSCNRQRIEQTKEGFALLGCLVNVFFGKKWDKSWQSLAEGVCLACPELWGYAGIDLILAEDGPVILEVNPRLTTSFAGIRSATGENAAAAVLDLLRTGKLPPFRSHEGRTVEIHLEDALGH